MTENREFYQEFKELFILSCGYGLRNAFFRMQIFLF